MLVLSLFERLQIIKFLHRSCTSCTCNLPTVLKSHESKRKKGTGFNHSKPNVMHKKKFPRMGIWKYLIIYDFVNSAYSLKRCKTIKPANLVNFKNKAQPFYSEMLRRNTASNLYFILCWCPPPHPPHSFVSITKFEKRKRRTILPLSATRSDAERLPIASDSSLEIHANPWLVKYVTSPSHRGGTSNTPPEPPSHPINFFNFWYSCIASKNKK